jgi:hypothetical protein
LEELAGIERKCSLKKLKGTQKELEIFSFSLEFKEWH